MAAVVVASLAAGHALHAEPAPARRHLVVCADPNNLPFSNRAGEGFENKLAALLAKELDADISYVWWAQRRGYVRNTLGEEKCDIWPGVAAGVDRVVTTKPYYRSTYVFVTRAADPLAGLTLDDPRLKARTIGVQMVGDDAMNTPPAHAMAARGLTENVRGYMLYGDYEQPNPPAAIVQAVAKGDVDIALVWGPLAGYFARTSPVPLRIEPVTPRIDASQWPMTYAIAMGVRKDEPELRGRIEATLDRDGAEIDRILDDYGVPRVSD